MKQPARTRTSGFTLIEMLIAMVVVAVGLIALAGVLIPVNHQRDQAALRLDVQSRAQGLMEEIKTTSPAAIANTYDVTTYPVLGVSGANPNGTVLTVDVDTTDPRLLVIQITGRWQVKNHVETLVLRTEIFDSSG